MNRAHKYGAVATEVDGRVFPSKREAKRYSELKLLARAGEITCLRLQPKFPLIVAGVKIADYLADFTYLDKAGRTVVEDAKGVRTPVYILKRKLVLALHGVEIVEV